MAVFTGWILVLIGLALTGGIFPDPASIDFVSANMLDSFGMDPYVRDPLLGFISVMAPAIAMASLLLSFMVIPITPSWGVADLHIGLLFFFAMAALNVYVFSYYDEATWVDFKLFGMLGLTLLFVVGQALFLARHLSQSQSEEGS